MWGGGLARSQPSLTCVLQKIECPRIVRHALISEAGLGAVLCVAEDVTLSPARLDQLLERLPSDIRLLTGDSMYAKTRGRYGSSFTNVEPVRARPEVLGVTRDHSADIARLTDSIAEHRRRSDELQRQVRGVMRVPRVSLGAPPHT